MTKFNPELPTLTFKVEKNGVLRAADPYALEKIDQVPYGTDLEIKFYQRRSLPKLKLYWTLLGMCVENSDNKYGRAEDLHDALKIALGYEHKVRRIVASKGRKILDGLLATMRLCWSRSNTSLSVDACQMRETITSAANLAKQLDEYVGDTIVLPGSISFSKMSEADFNVYFDKATAELGAAGYPVPEFLKEVERRHKLNKDYKPGSESSERAQAA